MTRKIKKPVINDKLKRPGQGKERRKSRLKLKTKLKNERSTISTVMEVKGLEIIRIKKYVNFTVQGGREVPRQDGVNESKIKNMFGGSFYRTCRVTESHLVRSAWDILVVPSVISSKIIGDLTRQIFIMTRDNHRDGSKMLESLVKECFLSSDDPCGDATTMNGTSHTQSPFANKTNAVAPSQSGARCDGGTVVVAFVSCIWCAHQKSCACAVLVWGPSPRGSGC